MMLAITKPAELMESKAMAASYSAEMSRGAEVNPGAERQFTVQMQQVAAMKRREADCLTFERLS